MRLALICGVIVALFAIAKDVRANDDAIKQLAPTETLRVAIAIGPAPSALYTVKDAG